MKRIILIVLLTALSLLTACSQSPGVSSTSSVTQPTTTYAQSTESSINETSTQPPTESTTKPLANGWSLLSSGESSDLYQVIWDGSRFVAVGDGLVMVSDQGLSWQKVSEGEMMTRLAYGDGKYVALYQTTDFLPAILVSENLETWLRFVFDGFANQANSTVNAVAYGDGKFLVAGTGGRTAYSEDGENWTVPYSLEVGNLRTIQHTGRQWYMGGDIGYVLLSDDGKTWQIKTTGDVDMTRQDPKISCMAYGALDDHTATIIMGDMRGNLYKADDQLASVQRLSQDENPFYGYGNFIDLIFDGSVFYAIHSSGILTSADGASWQPSDIPADLAWGIMSMATSPDRWVGVGQQGKIIIKERN